MWMFIKVQKDQYEFKNIEPDWCTDWTWQNWSQFIHMDPKDYLFDEFFKNRWFDLNKIKR